MTKTLYVFTVTVHSWIFLTFMIFFIVKKIVQYCYQQWLNKKSVLCIKQNNNKPYQSITLFISAHGLEYKDILLHNYKQINTTFVKEHVHILSVAGIWNVPCIFSTTSLVKNLSITENMLSVTRTIYRNTMSSVSLLINTCKIECNKILEHVLEGVHTSGVTTPSIIMYAYLFNKNNARDSIRYIIYKWLHETTSTKNKKYINQHIYGIECRIIEYYHNGLHPRDIFHHMLDELYQFEHHFISEFEFMEQYRSIHSDWYTLLGSFIKEKTCSLIRPHHDKIFMFQPNKSENKQLRAHYGIHIINIRDTNDTNVLSTPYHDFSPTHNIISFEYNIPILQNFHTTLQRTRQCRLSDLLVELQNICEEVYLIDTTCRTDKNPTVSKHISTMIYKYEHVL
jgi:hypothetical protein